MNDLFNEIDAAMPAISLWQPWASLPFAIGPCGFIKKHETRHWRYPEKLHGKRALMHASKNKTEMRDVPRMWRDAVGEFHFGAFVGTVVLDGCFRTTDLAPDEHDENAGNWGPGRYAWRLADPVKFETPIPAVGRQGFWSVPAELLEAA